VAIPLPKAAATAGQQIWNGATAPIFLKPSPGSIILNAAVPDGARAVIQWGGNTYNALTGPNSESKNAGGFNVGKSATLVFTATQSNGDLNIDNSGSPSEIFGQMIANDPPVYAVAARREHQRHHRYPDANIAVPQGIGRSAPA
jgi:hypothetical protein